MAAQSKPRAPAGLGQAGRAVWSRLVAVYDLEPHELLLLGAAARQADAVAEVEELVRTEGLVVTGSQGQRRLHGAVAEARQGRLVLARLLGQISLPAEGEAKPLTEAGRRSQRAAAARWQQKRAAAERRREAWGSDGSA